MKRRTRMAGFTFLSLWTIAACSMNTQSGADWIELFDGTGTTAWRGYLKPELPEGWRVVDGALTSVGARVDLITKDQFENFELTLDWKLTKGGNSGIFFGVREDSSLRAVYFSGPEMQILDNEAHRDALDPRTSAGSNYALHAPVRDVTRPVGEWNSVRLIVHDGHVEHWLNGEKLLEYDLDSEDWKRRVANSKFKDMPAYGTARRGHIALQGDHGWVAFRRIRIRPMQ